MRKASAAVAAVTIAGVAWMGLAPTSIGLSAGVGAMECRAVLAPIDAADLTDSLTEQQRELRQEWLAQNLYIDDVADDPTREQAAEVFTNVRALCADARQTRTVWMMLTAVFGTGAALVLAFTRRVESPARTTDKGNTPS
jgi:sensor c-di-GMP phosphodiesterase-like protein